MRIPPVAAGEKTFPEKAAGFSLWLLAATPVAMLVSYRITSILLPLAMLPGLLQMVRGELSLSPQAYWPRFFVFAGTIFIAWCAISSSWSVDPLESLISTAKVAGIVFAAWLCGAYLLGQNVISARLWRKHLTVAYFVSASSVLALILLNYFVLSDRFESEEYKNIYLVSPAGNVILRSWYNQVVAFMILCAWVVAAGQCSHLTWLRLLTLLIALAVAVSVGYWIGVVAFVAGTLVFLVSLQFKRQVSVLMAVAVLAATISLPWISSHFSTFEQAVETPPSGNPSVVHRTLIWRFASDAIAEKPLIGWGMNGSRHIPGGNEKIPLQVGGVPKNFERLPLHPHSTILQLWLELGVVGAVLYALIISGLFILLGRMQQPGRFCELALGGLTAAVVMMGASFSLWSNWWLAAMGIVTVMGVFITRHRGPTVDQISS